MAHGELAEGAQPGAENLYVESQNGSTWSPPRLVAVLSAEDGNDWDAGLGGNLGVGGLTSRVSPDGRFLAFMSERSLTGYDNRDASSGQPDEEVFEYDEATARLSCVSCDRTGVRPAGMLDGGSPPPLVDETGVWAGRWLTASLPTWTPYGNAKYTLEDSYPSRALADGGRLFFDSPDALVASDTNGKGDVYEYEPDGVGSCALPAGCVSLISSGTSSEESVFLDASETGDDVFFLTAARLTAQDVDTRPTSTTRMSVRVRCRACRCRCPRRRARVATPARRHPRRSRRSTVLRRARRSPGRATFPRRRRGALVK